MKWLLTFMPVVALILSCLALSRGKVAWEAKDSRGRTRMVLLEEGDSVQFAILATSGQQRVAFTIAESGIPSFALHGEEDVGGISWIAFPGGDWGLAVQSDAKEFVSLAAKQDQLGLVSGIAGEPPCIELMANPGYQSFLALHATHDRGTDEVGFFCGNGGKYDGAGFTIGNPNKSAHRAGIISMKYSSYFFLGGERSQGGGKASRIMMMFDQDSGCSLAIPGQSEAVVSLVNRPSQGVGLLAEVQKKIRMLVGNAPKSEPGLQVFDSNGRQVLNLPEK